MSKRRIVVLALIGVTAIVGNRMVFRRANDMRDDIREAVFRYQFTHNCWGQPEKVYFLSVGEDKDPSPEFMKRFEGNKPPVKPVSRCRIDNKSVQRPKTSVVDIETGNCGLIFSVDSNIKWLASKKVEVKGGYYADGLGASSNTFIVELRNGHWVVVKDTIDMIS